MPNKPYIEQEKRFRRKVNEMAPKIYAAFAIALHRHFGFGYERILRVLIESQELWRESAYGGLDIIQLRSDEVGIDMMSHLTAKEKGVEGERI